MKANKNGTFRLKDLKFYGLMGTKFYASVENNYIQAFKSKKHTRENSELYELQAVSSEFRTNGKYFIEVVTDKGTFTAAHQLGVLLF
jgi:hypothetical protein